MDTENDDDNDNNMEEIKVATDLHAKCGSDVISAIMRNVQLMKGTTFQTYIAIGGTVCAGMSLMGIIAGQAGRVGKLDDQTVSDRTLYAMLFAWMSTDPGHREGGAIETAKIAQEARLAWESITNKPFDSSWLNQGVINMLKKGEH